MAASKMRRSDAPSSAGWCLPPWPPCSSSRRCSQSFTHVSQRTRRPQRRTKMSEASHKINPYFLTLLIVALSLAAWGVIGRVVARNSLGKVTAIEAMPTVVTVRAIRTDLGEELVLPGTVQAYIESPIYARTNGYLKAWYTDIGSTVKRGQLLAE